MELQYPQSSLSRDTLCDGLRYLNFSGVGLLACFLVMEDQYQWMFGIQDGLDPCNV